MTDRKRALQEAWRALAGWHVGMVASDGLVVLEATVSAITHGGWDLVAAEKDGDEWETIHDYWGFLVLPDLDAPANHGVWEAYVREHSDGYVLIRRAPSWTRVSVSGREHKSTCYASALLGAYVRWVPEGAIPPEVLAWWELEQGEVSDG